MDSFIALMGYVGIVFLLISYFMLMVGQLKVTDTHYIVMNGLGAFFIGITLHNGTELPVFYTVIAWMVISVYGFYKHHILSK